MTSLREIGRWINDRRELVLDLIRIYLGIGLFARGILFITEARGVEAVVNLSDFSLMSAAVVHYVSFVHLLGGLLLAVGLLTRLSALLQLPILAGAVFIHWQDGLLLADQSLEFSALVLFLLCVVALFGAGRWSADHYVFLREPELREKEELEPWWRGVDERVRQPVTAGGESSRVATEVGPSQDAGSSPEITQCPCGHDLNHPPVAVEPRYGWFAGFFFMLGISAPVKEVIFYCEECGTILKRTRDRDVCRRYQWHTS